MNIKNFYASLFLSIFLCATSKGNSCQKCYKEIEFYKKSLLEVVLDECADVETYYYFMGKIDAYSEDLETIKSHHKIKINKSNTP